MRIDPQIRPPNVQQGTLSHTGDTVKPEKKKKAPPLATTKKTLYYHKKIIYTSSRPCWILVSFMELCMLKSESKEEHESEATLESHPPLFDGGGGRAAHRFLCGIPRTWSWITGDCIPEVLTTAGRAPCSGTPGPPQLQFLRPHRLGIPPSPALRLARAPPDAAAGPATRHWIKNSSSRPLSRPPGQGPYLPCWS